MEAEKLRCGVRLTEASSPGRLLGQGHGQPGTVDCSLNLPPPAFLDRFPESTMTQGVRGPQGGQVSSQQSLTMAKRTGIVPGHTVL